MLYPHCTVQDVKDVIQKIQAFMPYDSSYNRTSVKTLHKYETLLEFLEADSENIYYMGDVVVIDNKYYASLVKKKWKHINKRKWYPYGNPVDLLHKLRGSADAQ